jgi:hypothetical protein
MTGDVDIFLANKKSTHNTTVCTNHNPPQIGQEWRELDYWDYGETIKLSNQIPGNSIKECLYIIKNADKVEMTIEDWNKDHTTQ